MKTVKMQVLSDKALRDAIADLREHQSIVMFCMNEERGPQTEDETFAFLIMAGAACSMIENLEARMNKGQTQ